ncbi:hypothetical protein DMC64_41980 [Amycolatopsis sp. WAC 04197]|uniref:hypothetical protein n=1 Tax=Amycolatopsis sp. WAC 04197 TaxID=2203199 RepID=UPI000F76E5BB|nr:hypothetical protein [Amycolatopsis sp. WAC 04197]RSN38638.1 hypothetical protein DMC64_41980 [Amycolatopsis sp. WAC 04197]
MKTKRAAEARTALTDAAAALNDLITRIHPEDGCLPVPQITVPADQASLDAEREVIALNLFEGLGHHRASRWITIRAACSHLDSDALDGIYELVYRWYQLLNAAYEHVEVRSPIRRLHELADVKARLDAGIKAEITDLRPKIR